MDDRQHGGPTVIHGNGQGDAPSDAEATVRTEGAFVGRDREMRQLLSGLDEASSGTGSLILVIGEPGIGKTRLAAEFVAEAERRGARVLSGRCWEAGGAPAYWPWIQLIRGHMRGADQDLLKAQLASSAASVALIVPEVRQLFPDLPESPSLDSEGARFRMFDDVAGFFRNIAREGAPLVLIVDDLHAADEPSLLLLRFILRDLATTPVLILAPSRIVDRDDPLRPAFIEMLRESHTHRLGLAGLGAPDVGQLIEGVTGTAPTPELIELVLEETEGNPLFVTEVVRLLADQGRLAPSTEGLESAIVVPETVRDVIAQRLRRLSDECIRVLTLASLLGREFELETLTRLSQLSRREVLGLLDEAVSLEVISPLPSMLGRWRFAHVLIRDVLYETLGSVERMDLHRRAGEVLEELYRDNDEPHLSELAYHFFHAALELDPNTAIDYARRAGDRAARLLAFEEATRFYGMALNALELKPGRDEELRCELLIAAGDAEARGGDHAAAQVTFLDAADSARKSRRPDLLGAAALGYAGRFVWPREGDDRRLVPFLEEALESVGRQDGPLRARLLARLSGALRDREPRELAAELSEQAVEMARRIGDPATISYALEGRFGAAWGPENPEERLAIGTELVRLAEETGDLEHAFQGHDARVCAYLDLGEIRKLDVELEIERHLVEELRQPAQLWLLTQSRAMRALMDGRFLEAEELITEADVLGAQAHRSEANFVTRIQTFLLRKEQGRLSEVEAIVTRSVVEYPTRYVFRALLAHLLTELNRTSEARAAFESLAADDFASIRMDSDYLLALSLLCDVADHLDDVPRARQIYERLVPFEGRFASSGEACTGSVARSLGMLASVCSRWEEAVRHLENALAANEDVGARPWASHTRVATARMLLSRDAPGDRDRAAELLFDAARECDELGMVALRAKIGTLASSAGLREPFPERSELWSPRSDLGGIPSVFRREGEYWTIEFEGDAFRLRDTKGLGYLGALLARPGRETLALELIGSRSTRRPIREPSRASGFEAGTNDVGPLLDERAKSDYRRRLTDLESELAEAEAWADPERAARARAEIDLLERELAAAVGIGGRDRRVSSDAERARVSVTKSIRSAMQRIGEQSPSLARHLANTIHTGTFCSYMPDPRVEGAWRL